MNDGMKFIILIGLMGVVLLGLIIYVLTDPQITQQTKKIDNGREYGCGGTSYDVSNCVMINKKLDRLLVILESKT